MTDWRLSWIPAISSSKQPRSGTVALVSLRGAAANGRSSACSRTDSLNCALGTGESNMNANKFELAIELEQRVEHARFDRSDDPCDDGRAGA
jgi:hypothetical protein